MHALSSPFNSCTVTNFFSTHPTQTKLRSLTKVIFNNKPEVRFIYNLKSWSVKWLNCLLEFTPKRGVSSTPWGSHGCVYAKPTDGWMPSSWPARASIKETRSKHLEVVKDESNTLYVYGIMEVSTQFLSMLWCCGHVSKEWPGIWDMLQYWWPLWIGIVMRTSYV